MTNSINVLVEAKNECTDKLTRVISPVAIEVMLTLYNDAIEMSKGRQPLSQYQKLLQEVKSWSDTINHDNTQRIIESCNYFRDILTAVFICYTKIMSSIRLGTVKKSISLKIPTDEIFVHTVFKELADSLYNDPYFLQEMTEYHIKKEMTARVHHSIETSIKILSPLDQILKTYVNLTEEIDMGEDDESSDPDIDSDTEQPEAVDPIEEQEDLFPQDMEHQGQEQDMDQHQELAPADDMEPHLEEATDKIISFGQEEEEEEDEDLFPEAPEKNMG
jgi:hypothetical protein